MILFRNFHSAPAAAATPARIRLLQARRKQRFQCVGYFYPATPPRNRTPWLRRIRYRSNRPRGQLRPTPSPDIDPSFRHLRCAPEPRLAMVLHQIVPTSRFVDLRCPPREMRTAATPKALGSADANAAIAAQIRAGFAPSGERASEQLPRGPFHFARRRVE